MTNLQTMFEVPVVEIGQGR